MTVKRISDERFDFKSLKCKQWIVCQETEKLWYFDDNQGLWATCFTCKHTWYTWHWNTDY